jgi:hypothetical protein
MIDLGALKATRFADLPIHCDSPEPGVDDTEEWRDWTVFETTPDQLRIENYLATQNLLGKSILHVGVGNSSLAQRFSARASRIVGTTIAKSEKIYGDSLQISSYIVEMNNKYSGKPIVSGSNFDFIVDNNPSTFACCLTHLMAMMQLYRDSLSPNGQILTDRAGLGWVANDPGANPRWKFDFDDLAMVAQQVGLQTFAIDNNVIAVSRVKPRPVRDMSIKGMLRPFVRPVKRALARLRG